MKRHHYIFMALAVAVIGLLLLGSRMVHPRSKVEICFVGYTNAAVSTHVKVVGHQRLAVFAVTNGTPFVVELDSYELKVVNPDPSTTLNLLKTHYTFKPRTRALVVLPVTPEYDWELNANFQTAGGPTYPAWYVDAKTDLSNVGLGGLYSLIPAPGLATRTWEVAAAENTHLR